MSQLNALLSDLRDKKLWPLAIVLLAAVVAVPVLLSSSSTPPPAQPLPSLATPVSATANVPTVTVNAAPGQAAVTGSAHDPFVQQPLPALKTTGTGAAGNAAAALASAAASAISSASSGGSGASGSSTGSSTSTTTVAPKLPVNPQPTTPAPVPTGLTATQSYSVGLSLSDPSGTLSSPALQVRDSMFPNSQSPLLVYLGVLNGGRRVLFAVIPGTVLTGGGTCVPGPMYCQVLSLAQGQQESVATSSTASTPWMFAVAKIYGTSDGSAAAAMQARNAVSRPGQSILDAANLAAVQLFQYDPSIGALVDQRNLTVGGN